MVQAATLSAKINTLLHHGQPPLHIGVVVEQLSTHKILYEKNSRQLFAPASTQKLITTTASYNLLKPGFRFITQLYATAKPGPKGVLAGNVYIKFSGDPSLRAKDVASLLAVLKKKGVRRIAGHVYVDNSAYDFVAYAPGWIWDDLSYAYAAPLNAVIINQNHFILQLTPHGEHVRLQSRLPRGLMHFENQILATTKPIKHCPLRIYSTQHNVFHLTGCVDARRHRQFRELAITDPVAYAKRLIALDLKQQKIPFVGAVRVHKLRSTAWMVAQHRSKPLTHLMKTMLKESNNLYADSLLKKIGQRYNHAQGTWQNSLRALQAILSPTHIDFKKILLNDGAGMSRYNLLSPHALMQLLVYVHTQTHLRAQLWEDLPIAGVDGTLEWRFKHHPHRGIHAKTGNMTGVSNLAGFIRSRRYGNLAFVIMINGFVGKHTHKAMWHLQDRFALLLAA